jgi:hypothetical protein
MSFEPSHHYGDSYLLLTRSHRMIDEGMHRNYDLTVRLSRKYLTVKQGQPIFA